MGQSADRHQLLADATSAYTRAARMLDSLRLHVWEDMGITFPQLRILFVIRHDPGSDLRSLARALGVGTSAASQQVERLVERGLLLRREDPEDRRRIQLHLTSRGEEAAESISLASREYLRGLFDRFSDDELRELTASLALIVNAAADTPPPHLPAARRA